MIPLNIQVFKVIILMGVMMTRYATSSLLMSLIILCLSGVAHSTEQLYNGRMEILVTSGKACEGFERLHDVSLVLHEEVGGALYGYFNGGVISIGRFSGNDPARLDVRYPYLDEQRASGHFMSLSRTDTTLVAELHDRHIDAAAEDCNFDLARLVLTRSVGVDAKARLAQMTGLFDAQLLRSQAVALAQSSGYAAALPYFERALALADTCIEKGSDQINSYLIGLATSYIWLDRSEEFNRLFDTRIMAMQDDGLRSVFSGYRIRGYMAAGLAALGRDEFDAAQAHFEQAYQLKPDNREVIAAVMSVHIRQGRYVEAVAFLKRTESIVVNETDRADIRAAMAMVLFKKAQKDDNDGNAPESENSLKQAVELDPATASYLIAFARQRHKAGHLDDAERLLEQGLARIKDPPSQEAILNARDKMRQTEMFLKKLRKAGH